MCYSLHCVCYCGVANVAAYIVFVGLYPSVAAAVAFIKTVLSMLLLSFAVQCCWCYSRLVTAGAFFFSTLSFCQSNNYVYGSFCPSGTSESGLLEGLTATYLEQYFYDAVLLM